MHLCAGKVLKALTWIESLIITHKLYLFIDEIKSKKYVGEKFIPR